MTMDENVWISARKYKPSDDERYLVRDGDYNYTIAQYDPETRLWRNDNWQIVEVVKYMRIPDED